MAEKMIVLFSVLFCCSFSTGGEKLFFSSVPFFHTKGSVVEVNSVIMDTCFEFTMATQDERERIGSWQSGESEWKPSQASL